MMNNVIMNNSIIVGIITLVIIVIVYYYNSQSHFNDNLNGTITNDQPESFPPLDQKVSNVFDIKTPDVPEEIGLAMKYPQGDGVGMSRLDSNSFYPGSPGPLLTDHTFPDSYGESSLTDPTGNLGANQGARILRIVDTGNQMNYKPIDETEDEVFHSAYTNTEVGSTETFINGTLPINYGDSFNPENNLKIQTSPGQASTLKNCEIMYPNVVKYGDFCITEGDIPYGQVVDNKVNPRLVSRWESYTGEYSRKDALNPIDGVLYPNLNVLTS
jgi:hypothetical protein